MNIRKHNFLLFSLIIMLCGLLSCSGSKNLTANDSTDNLNEIKEQLKFKTHFGADGSMNIKATNSGAKALDISMLSVIIDQVDGKANKAYTLEELEVKSVIPPLEVAIFDLSLEEKINVDFDGAFGKYNVILAYDTKSPLDNTDNRSVYFITYKYPIK